MECCARAAPHDRVLDSISAVNPKPISSTVAEFTFCPVLQRDFCAIGGYVHSLGYDLAPMRAPIENIRCVTIHLHCKISGSTLLIC